MKRKTQKNKGKVICPCCKSLVSFDDYKTLKKGYDVLVKNKGLHLDKLKKFAKHSHWACDTCIENKKANIANPLVQHYYGYYLPFFMYFDIEKNCESCSKDFIFSKEEQKHWYEVLKFYVFSVATRCKDCRKDRRAMIAQNNRLMELTALEDKTAEQLKELADIYHEIGSEEKSRMYANQLKKLNIK